MARQKSNIHYLYKTTCLITGRYYIGMHSTSNLNDDYLGSGKRLRYSMRKHGVDNHKKEVLEFFDSRELLIEAEKKAITSDMITDKNCMNIMGGGTGGFISEEQQRHRSECANKRLNQLLTSDEKFRKNWIKNLHDGIRKSYNDGRISKGGGWNKGGFHTDETKKIMSDSHKGQGIDSLNSQFGTCWITRNGENKKIKKENLDSYISDGWVKGRK